MSGRGDDPCRCALPQDNRFRAPEWQTFPFNVYAHGFLAMEQRWEAATTDVRGVSGQHQAMTTFGARQMLDTVAPSNFVWTNPQVLARIRETGGGSLIQGFSNWLDDQQRLFAGHSPAGSEACIPSSPPTTLHPSGISMNESAMMRMPWKRSVQAAATSPRATR